MTVRLLRWTVSLVGAIAIAAAPAESGQTPNRAAVPVFALSVRVNTDTPALDVDGRVTVPGGNQPIDAIALAIDQRLEDLDVSVVSPVASAGSASVSIERRAAVHRVPARGHPRRRRLRTR